jgi:hypothetical protein
MSKRKTTEEARAEVISLGRVPGPDFVYKDSRAKMQLVCPNNNFYHMRMSDIVADYGCNCKKCCPKHYPKTTEEARKQVTALGHKPGPDFVYENAKTKMQLVCPNSSGFYYAVMGNLVKGHRCNCKKCCPKNYPKTTEEARKQVIIRGHAPGPDFKYENNRTRMQLICPNGAFYYITMGNIVDGHGCNCNRCSGLKRERICREWFENKFQQPFPKSKPSWLVNHTGRRLELDGYCEELKIAFEYNGKQHYEPCQFSSGQTTEDMMKNFTAQRQRDNLKSKLCTEHGVKLIVVPYNKKNIRVFLEDYFNNLTHCA